jgi:haloalkane dehalogenase
VILNTAAFSANHTPRRIALCALPLLGPLIVRGCNGFARPATAMAMRRRVMMPDEKRGYLFPYDSWANRVAVNAFVRDIPLTPSHPSWATLATVETGLPQFRERPALIVWGGLDFCFDDEFLARWQVALTAVQCTRIADAGHYVLEDAAPQVIPLVCAHLLVR